MNELQVPTRRIPVEVFLRTGDRLEGALFLADSVFHARKPWEVLAVLNDDRRFVPFVSEASEPERFVLNKEHILRVRLKAGDPPAGDEEPWPGLCVIEPPDPSVLHLLDGQRLRGQICIDTRPDASRPLDKLNQAHMFVAVHCPDGLVFVRTAAVVRVD